MMAPTMRAQAIRYLVLWPTAACNLDCAYCYRTTRAGGRMRIATVDQAFELAERSASHHGGSFHVQVAGGEPTLVPDVLAHVIKRVGASPHAAGCGVQTNGTALTPQLLTHLRQPWVQVGVSLDGPPGVQERLRGRAAATFAGLSRLAQADIPVRITTVLSAGNVDSLPDLVLALASLPNVVGIGLDPVVQLGSAAGRSDLVADPEHVIEGVTRMYQALAFVNSTRSRPIQWRELTRVRTSLSARHSASILTHRIGKRLAMANKTRAFCHAALGESIAVAPDGSLYPCSQSVGHPEHCAGTLSSFDHEKLKRIHADATLTGECHACELSGYCPGDCPSRVAAEGGPPGSQKPAHPIACVIYRTLAQLEAGS